MTKNNKHKVNFQIDIIVESNLWDNIENIQQSIKEVCKLTILNNKFCKNIKLFDVAIVLSENKLVQDLNGKYRNKLKPTNVLSFPDEDLNPYEQDYLLIEELCAGGIVLAYETILEESDQQDKQVVDHILHLVIHGILHLLGYDHKNEKEAKIMECLEIEILKMLKINNPYLYK